jgi:hypothetical protein
MLGMTAPLIILMLNLRRETTVKILDTLTFPRSAAHSAESVSLSSFCTYLLEKEKFKEYHGSIKLYNVDRLEKSFPVLVGQEVVDVQ